MQASIIKTDEDKCMGCNKCIFVCPGSANNAQIINDKNKINVSDDRCIQCGECIRVCDHGARDYNDDTEVFFDRLNKGDKISIIVAPALKNNCPEYKKLLSFLRHAGVNLIYDVSFGADITTWAYLKVIKEKKLTTMIAQPCPVIVSYIQKYKTELIPYLAPIHSPAMCSAIYLKKYCNIKDDLAFISPCIGKKIEFIDKNTYGYVKYNVTIIKLMEHLNKNNISLTNYRDDHFDDKPCDLGFVFSRPGGLRENVEYYTDGKVWVKQTEGINDACCYLEQYQNRIRNKKQVPLLIDILNCKNGCNIGTAVDTKTDIDDVDYKINQLKEKFLKETPTSQESQAFKNFDQNLLLDDFIRKYTDCSQHIKEATEKEIEEVFHQLGKTTPESRNINCFACGYGGCLKFATAVANGNNDIKNCINYSRVKLVTGKNEFDTIFESLENRIVEINTNLNKIKSLSSDLDKISFETKIISLNAKIEAAHAGEFGKSFSVVATAIQDLAEKSKKIIDANQLNQNNIMNDILSFEKTIEEIKTEIDAILQ